MVDEKRLRELVNQAYTSKDTTLRSMWTLARTVAAEAERLGKADVLEGAATHCCAECREILEDLARELREGKGSG